MDLHQVDDIGAQPIKGALDALPRGVGALLINLCGDQGFPAAPLQRAAQDALGVPVAGRGVEKIDPPAQGFMNDPGA